MLSLLKLCLFSCNFAPCRHFCPSLSRPSFSVNPLWHTRSPAITQKAAHMPRSAKSVFTFYFAAHSYMAGMNRDMELYNSGSPYKTPRLLRMFSMPFFSTSQSLHLTLLNARCNCCKIHRHAPFTIITCKFIQVVQFESMSNVNVKNIYRRRRMSRVRIGGAGGRRNVRLSRMQQRTVG